MNKVNIDAIDFGYELWKAIDGRFLFSPDKFVNSIVGKFLHVIEISTVIPATVVGHFVPWVSCDPGANGLQRVFRNIDTKRLAGCHKVVAKL